MIDDLKMTSKTHNQPFQEGARFLCLFVTSLSFLSNKSTDFRVCRNLKFFFFCRTKQPSTKFGQIVQREPSGLSNTAPETAPRKQAGHLFFCAGFSRSFCLKYFPGGSQTDRTLLNSYTLVISGHPRAVCRSQLLILLLPCAFLLDLSKRQLE